MENIEPYSELSDFSSCTSSNKAYIFQPEAEIILQT